MTKTAPATAAFAPRSGHPYYMYELLCDQPRAIAEVLERNRPAVRRLAPLIRRADSITLTGIGTSLNAAMLGEYWMRTLGHLDRARSQSAFELALYSPPIAPGAPLLLISHRGSKHLGAQVVAQARAAGALTVAICGQGPPGGARAADHVLITTEQERSGAHTVSLTTAMALMLELAIALGEADPRDPAALARARRELAAIPQSFARRIADDGQERAAAARFRDRRRILFVGAGPNYVSAREAALKMKEATFTWSEALELEEFLHGPIAGVDPETLVVILSARGPASERAAQAVRAVGELGAPRLGFIGAGETELAGLVDCAVTVESAHEPTSAFEMILSLQLFAYYSALARGCDPDRNHREDSRQARAAAHYRF